MSEHDWKTQVNQTKKKNDYIKVAAGVACFALAALLLVAYAPRFFTKAPEEVVVTPKPNAYEEVRISAKSAIVYDLVTGEVLFAHNAESQLPLASLTKLITVYASAEVLDGQVVSITEHSLTPEGDTGFTAGQTFSFSELAKLAMVGSSNDAAQAIADSALRRSPHKETLMAGALSSLGLTQTYVTNGTGLDQNTSLSGGYGSAYDIAVLAGAFLQRVPEVARATTLSSITTSSREGKSYTLKNTNPDVVNISGLMLSKTGYTDLAGGNLAIVYDAGIRHPIAIVVLGSTKDDRFLDVYNLVRATGKYFSASQLP
jgi:D-alanyl-D-alanine carboxypeptidase (penicillin-binding protein 5/6)